MRREVTLVLMLLIVGALPMVATAETAVAPDFCCDATEVELHLLGPADGGTLSPFGERLAETAEEVVIASSISSEEVVASWRLDDLPGGSIPDGTWQLRLPVRVENAGGAQVNITVEVGIGRDVYIGQLPVQSTFVGQGSSTLSVDIPVEAVEVSDGWDLEVVLLARTVIFSVPQSDSQLLIEWGAEDEDATLTGEMPTVDMDLLEVEVEGADAYFGVVISSAFGTDLLAFNDELSLRVDGTPLTGDPVETLSQNGVRITWTWTDPDPGERTLTVEVVLRLQTGTATMSSESVPVTFTTQGGGGGGGTYYPVDEPLRTTGAGSPLDIVSTVDLGADRGQLVLERETKLTIDGEMAFWMRWALDHLGSDDLTLSPTIRSFSTDRIGPEERESRVIETVEVQEFEREMGKLHVSFLANGFGLDPEELIGDSSAFSSVSISLDLHGEDRVMTHPLTLTILSREIVENNVGYDLIRDFIIVQPVPYWSAWSIDMEARGSGMSSFFGASLDDGEGLELTSRRMPLGEVLHLEGEGLEQDLSFGVQVVLTTAPLHAPMLISAALLVLLTTGLYLGWRLTKRRKRRLLLVETALMTPIIAAMFLLAYPSEMVLVSGSVCTLLWTASGRLSPLREGMEDEPETAPLPTIACPACASVIPVPSQERPLRVVCHGCQRGITIQG